MKFTYCILFMMVTGISSAALSATASQGLTGCAARQDEIREQIDFARWHGNRARMAGLQTALEEVRRHCRDDLLLRARQDRVEEKRRRVQESQAELQAAQESGRQDKVAKKQKKLRAAQEALAQAQSALEQ
ncbi:TPA: DUF1090 domain-containing protein [Salmonella enterica subsp. salamae serovar 28:r:e,n,z15]|nr:DUF1090 domain-containing protein [Salmonella enterica subsp. salamae serovar 28:r:e,n,z15]